MFNQQIVIVAAVGLFSPARAGMIKGYANRRRILLHGAVFLAAGLCLESSVAGQCEGVVTIDFGPSWGAPQSGFVILTDQLADEGVLFSTEDPEGVSGSEATRILLHIRMQSTPVPSVGPANPLASSRFEWTSPCR